MNKAKSFFFTLFLLLINFNSVKADVCDTNDIKRLRELSNNVSINYSIKQDGEYSNFNLEISGLTKEMYFYFYDDIENSYSYEETNNGTIVFEESSGDYKIKIASSACGTILKDINITIPKFNQYSLDDRCKKNKYANLDVCDEWYQFEGINTESEDFDINDYFEPKNKTFTINNFSSLFQKYYYIFIVSNLYVHWMQGSDIH